MNVWCRWCATLRWRFSAAATFSSTPRQSTSPTRVAAPARPGRLREASLWVYRSQAGAVWFDYQPNKSPKGPGRILSEAKYRGLLQTDAAVGLGNIGPPRQIVSLGCHAHLRR